MKNIFFKVGIASFIMIASLTSSACWYKIWKYNDYIYSINNFENHTMVQNVNGNIQYTIKNNQIVDFPCSVAINLEGNMTSNIENEEPSEIYCKLQYRVLPNNEWITVAERVFQPQTLPDNTLAAFYLGRNNINPSQIKKGDIIMIRLFVQRGHIMSGNENSLCDDQLINGKLQDEYQYTINDKASNATDFDLGGMWLPQYVITVKYSGKYRPVR